MRRSRRNLPLLACAGLACLAFGRGRPARAQDRVVPPDRLNGFTLEYAVRWNGIPAANVRVTLQSDLPTAPAPRHRLEANTWTSPLLGLIWPARSRVEASVARDLSSRHFFIYRKERRKEQTAEITFDTEADLVRIVRHKPSGSIREASLPLADLQEPLSVLYTLRNGSTALGQSYSANVVVNDDVYRLTVTVVERSTMRLAGRRMPVVCVLPLAAKLEDDGTTKPLKKVKSARIWVTDDPLRLPVRLQAHAFIGSVSVTLRRSTPSLRDIYAALEADGPLLAEAVTPAAPTGE